MKCSHTENRQTWTPGGYDWEGDWVEGHWEWEERRTTVDIDIGRYKCTKCGEVMYYTGTWRKYWEGK